MADSEPRLHSPPDTARVGDSNGDRGEKKLKHLEFVQVVVIYGVVCFTTVYEYAKENSGPLKPGVETVEATVKTVVGPVFDKFHDLPLELLRFFDRKVDAILSDLERHLPGVAKTVIRKAPDAAKMAASEIRRVGLVEAAKTLYETYEPVAEEYAVVAWRWLNRLPLFPTAAQMVLPTAAYWSELYNRAVKFSAERGIPVASCLPLVPLERIAKVFSEPQSAPAVAENGDGLLDRAVVENGDKSSSSDRAVVENGDKSSTLDHAVVENGDKSSPPECADGAKSPSWDKAVVENGDSSADPDIGVVRQ